MCAWAMQTGRRLGGYPAAGGAHQFQCQSVSVGGWQESIGAANRVACQYQLPQEQQLYQFEYQQQNQNPYYLSAQEAAAAAAGAQFQQTCGATQLLAAAPQATQHQHLKQLAPQQHCNLVTEQSVSERLHLHPKNENQVHKHLHGHNNSHGHSQQQQQSQGGAVLKQLKRHSFAVQQARLQAREYAAAAAAVAGGRQLQRRVHQQQEGRFAGLQHWQALEQQQQQQTGSEKESYSSTREKAQQLIQCAELGNAESLDEQVVVSGGGSCGVGGVGRTRVCSVSAALPVRRRATPVAAATPPPTRSISFSAAAGDEKFCAAGGCQCGCGYSCPQAQQQPQPQEVAASAAVTLSQQQQQLQVGWQQVARPSCGSLSSACSSTTGGSPAPTVYLHSPSSPPGALATPQHTQTSGYVGNSHCGNLDGPMTTSDALSFGINLEQYISKRNERERSRVRNVNDAFDHLKHALPLEADKLSKRVSKVEILRQAISYIRELEQVLGYRPQASSATATATAPATAAVSSSAWASSPVLADEPRDRLNL